MFLPPSSDKSKRRTKTVKKSAEPKWNQTFLYSHVHRRDFRERMLEITVWDQPRVQEEESEFLGEVGDTPRPFKLVEDADETLAARLPYTAAFKRQYTSNTCISCYLH